jgi:glucan phosphorylase
MAAETDDAGRALRRRLRDLALNLWWTWHGETIELFRDLDPAVWREVNHNPIALRWRRATIASLRT